MFKPGDRVMCDGEGPYTLKAYDSKVYPLTINGKDSFTLEGRCIPSGKVHLQLVTPTGVTNYQLGQVQTLDDGTQIYHPTNGQPFQLIPTTKALLC